MVADFFGMMLFKYQCIHILTKDGFNSVLKVLDRRAYHNFLHSYRVYKLGNRFSRVNVMASLLHDLNDHERASQLLDASRLCNYDICSCLSMIQASYDHTTDYDNPMGRDLPPSEFQARDLLAYLLYPENEELIRKEFEEVPDDKFYPARLEILKKIQGSIDKRSHLITGVRYLKDPSKTVLLMSGFKDEIKKIEEKIGTF